MQGGLAWCVCHQQDFPVVEHRCRQHLAVTHGKPAGIALREHTAFAGKELQFGERRRLRRRLAIEGHCAGCVRAWMEGEQGAQAEEAERFAGHGCMKASVERKAEGMRTACDRVIARLDRQPGAKSGRN